LVALLTVRKRTLLVPPIDTSLVRNCLVKNLHRGKGYPPILKQWEMSYKNDIGDWGKRFLEGGRKPYTDMEWKYCPREGR
jgi:hypothetical protein